MKKRTLYLFGAILMLSGSAGGLWVSPEGSWWPSEVATLINGEPNGSSELFFACQMAIGLGFMHVATARAVRTSHIVKRGRIIHALVGCTLFVSGGLLLFSGINVLQWLQASFRAAAAITVTPNTSTVFAAKVGLCVASVLAVLCGLFGFASCRKVDYFSNPHWKNTLVFFGGYLCVAGLIGWGLLNAMAANRAYAMMVPSEEMPAKPADVASAISLVSYCGIARALFTMFVAIFLIPAAVFSPGRPVPEAYSDMH